IPGHGPIGNKSQLIEFRDMLVTVREKVAALKKQGKSRDEVVAAKPTSNYDAKWGGFVINGDFFTRVVYGGRWLGRARRRLNDHSQPLRSKGIAGPARDGDPGQGHDGVRPN